MPERYHDEVPRTRPVMIRIRKEVVHVLIQCTTNPPCSIASLRPNHTLFRKENQPHFRKKKPKFEVYLCDFRKKNDSLLFRIVSQMKP
jgi:hypothetical protein